MLKKISNELNFYFFRKNNIFLGLVISCHRGWGMFSLKSGCLLIQERNMISYSSKKLLKGYSQTLQIYFFSFYKNYFHFVKLKGMGFKIIMINKKVLLFKLGYSHRIIVQLSSNLKFWYITKQTFKVESRNFNAMKEFISNVLKFRKMNSYKKKGLYLKGSVIKVKLSSKKSKF